jgi:hypothetical protein
MPNLEKGDVHPRHATTRDKHDGAGGGSASLRKDKQERSQGGRTSRDKNPNWTPERLGFKPSPHGFDHTTKESATVIKQDLKRSSVRKPAVDPARYYSDEVYDDGESVFSDTDGEEDEEEVSKKRVDECVRNMLETSADDGQGNECESGDESEEEESYDVEMSEHFSTEKDLAINPRNTLSQNGMVRVKTGAVFALELLTLLHASHQRELSGKRPLGSVTDKIITMWENAVSDGFEYEKTDEMVSEVRAWRAHASTKNKNKGRRTSMESYQAESDSYWAHHCSRYLVDPEAIVSLKQCINIVRSKKVHEALLFKTTGTTGAWHRKAEIFYHADKTVGSMELMEFAHKTFGFPIGERYEKDKTNFYVNEMVRTHRGMRAVDWNRRIWYTRGARFDENGDIVQREKKAAAKPQKAIVPLGGESEAGDSEAGDSGESERDLALSGDSESDTGARPAMKKSKAEKKRAKKNRRKSVHEVAEEKLSEELAEKNAALKREREKNDRTYQKLLKDGQVKLPDLDGTPEKGFDSAIEFQARSESSAWAPLQQMGHLQEQATVEDADGKEVPREGAHSGVAVGTLDYVKKLVEHAIKKKHPGYEFALSGKEWADKVMEKFWEEWFETYVQPEETDEASRLLAKKQRLAWEQCHFWYGISPTQCLKLLGKMQAAGLACGFYISERDLKNKISRVCTTSDPDIQRCKLTGGDQALLRLLGARGCEHGVEIDGGGGTEVVQIGWSQSDKATEAPNTGVNLSKLRMTCEMDCNKDSMPNNDGRLRPVPMSRRTAEWGFTAEAQPCCEMPTSPRPIPSRVPARIVM